MYDQIARYANKKCIWLSNLISSDFYLFLTSRSMTSQMSERYNEQNGNKKTAMLRDENLLMSFFFFAIFCKAIFKQIYFGMKQNKNN